MKVEPTYVAGAFVLVVTSLYFSYLFPALAIISPIAMGLLLQIPLYISGGLVFPRGRNNQHANAMLLVVLILAASIWFAMSHDWIRFVAYAALLMPGPFIMAALLVPNNDWLGPVVTHVVTGRREVWLTIDDGPTADTAALLDLLDRMEVRATFFVKGMLVTPDLVAAITSRGHTIGNHSHTHPSGSFWCLPPRALAREIDSCLAVIPPTNLFRAPVGHKNLFLHRLLRERGLRLIAFSARAYDAVVSDPERIARTIASQVKPGAIIVLHQGREWSLRAIERTIEEVRALGYDFVIPAIR